MSSHLAFDSLIASRGRLRILTALAAEPRCDFVRLRGLTQLTDGNLATHARRLESAGLVAVQKSFRDRKPVTHMTLTPDGRDALERHARELMTALGMMPAGTPTAPQEAEIQAEKLMMAAPSGVPMGAGDEEWVD